MTRPQWWFDSTAIDVLALCVHLDARTSNNPDHIDDFVAPSGNQDPKRLISIAEELRLVRSDPRWSDAEHVYDPVVIMPPGRRHVRAIAERLNRRDERFAAARQGLLLWAYGYAADHPDLPMNNPRRFLDADPSYNFWGQPFTDSDVREATDYLLDARLLELFGARKANGEPQNIKITRDGKDCVEGYGGSAAAFRRAQGAVSVGASFIQNFNGSFHGQNAQGATVTQVQHNGIDPAALAAIFADLRAPLSRVDDADDRTDLTVAIEDLERVATSDVPDLADVNRRVGSLNRLASRIGNTAVTTSVSTGTSGLLDLLGGAIS